MSTEVTEPAAGEALLDDETAWSGRIFSDGWVDAPETIETTEPATGERARHGGRRQRRGGRARRRVRRPSPARVGRDPVHRARRHRAPRGRAARAPPRGADPAGSCARAGAIPPKADNEISASIGQFEMAAALISHPLGQVLPSLMPGRTSMARRVPVGVVGVICPWNFPVVLPARSVGPALALGNAVILKSDPNTPVSGGVLIARIFEEAGLPEGVLHVIGGGAEVGQALVEDPNVRMISFTGSTATGRKVGEPAGPQPQAHRARAGRQQPARRARGRRHRGGLVRRARGARSCTRARSAWRSAATSCTRASPTTTSRRSPSARRTCRSATRPPSEVALGPIINQKQVERVAADRRRQRVAGRDAGHRRHAREPLLPADRALAT